MSGVITSPWRVIALGALAVGTLDILDAIVFYGLRNNVGPQHIFQSVAAGLLGRASYSGGMSTAVLGLILHFEIATIVVCVYYGVSRKLPGLARRPLLWGPLYGIAVYVVMNFVVLPLSAAGTGRLLWPVVITGPLINGILIHVFGVGIPSALAAQRAARG